MGGAAPLAGARRPWPAQPGRFFDPWYRAYRYERSEDGGVTIGTLGRDGKEGGVDEDADVSVHFAPAEPLPRRVEPRRGESRVEGAAEEVVEGGASVGQ
jgi:Type II secretion system (T2SS), protein G